MARTAANDIGIGCSAHRTPRMASTPEKDFQNDLEAIRVDVKALSDTVGNLIAEASKAQAAMGKTIKKAAKNAAGDVEEMWDGAVNLGHDAAEATRIAAHAGVSTIDTEIKRNPIYAVLISLGIGFLVGILNRK
jgi:ElaB/YqjD/DUF883 family membrane-anchored ribosome-binding protein